MDISPKTMTFTEMLAVYEQLEAEGRTPVIIPPSGDDLDSPERIAAQKARGPRRGDLYHADAGYGYYGAYVLLLDKPDKDGNVRVIPLVNTLRAANRNTIIVADTPLDMPMTACTDMHAVIPASTLCKPLKTLPAPVVDALEADRADAALGLRRGTGEWTDDYPDYYGETVWGMIALHALCFDDPSD